MYTYQAALVRVVDGDTVDLLVDLGFKVSVNIRARLFGVNTPEITGVRHDSDEYRRGIEAREFVKKWFAESDDKVLIRSHDGRHVRAGKFGRWIVEIERLSDGAHLSPALVKTGHAVEVGY